MTDQNVQIRLAGGNDRETVVRVFHEAGLDTAEAMAQGTTYWVMERGGQPIGAIGLEHGDGASLLRGAAVLPEARGGGLGRRLVMSAIEYAQGRGDREIYMFSKGGDWSTFGFTQVPMALVMGDVPDAPQVKAYRAGGHRPGDTTWMRDLSGGASQA
ncbi:GNAT family N-acetyltransferase [Deinococcus arenicola]|uniref:GNAT family N-acetyltransferase n=1 Tax=Deinococcus arenicola TaxID=2994950 RepID=A0ABU4DMJ8_9DEIO|nr:GNAT family N-acetyltransferase [Deinococcus sp. ZS9-10]MDV6373177.1 GNAT family N-acetyltransferase [Deinococcus sp. ZS9-10]